MAVGWVAVVLVLEAPTMVMATLAAPLSVAVLVVVEEEEEKALVSRAIIPVGRLTPNRGGWGVRK